MYEHLKTLDATLRVLDLGCSTGSFPAEITRAQLVRLDRDAAPGAGVGFVQGDAAALPFRAHSFDVVIANHSFEHFDELARVAAEVGRILKPGAVLFVSVPDASTWTDKIYRWMARGGGHVNAFTQASDLPAVIGPATGLPLTAVIVLHSGLSFLNRRNIKTMALRMALAAYGSERVLMLVSVAARKLDKVWGTRLSVYGWAYYFGPYSPKSLAAMTNVCIRCGSGHSANELRSGCRGKNGSAATVAQAAEPRIYLPKTTANF